MLLVSVSYADCISLCLVCSASVQLKASSNAAASKAILVKLGPVMNLLSNLALVDVNVEVLNENNGNVSFIDVNGC